MLFQLAVASAVDMLLWLPQCFFGFELTSAHCIYVQGWG